MYATEDNLLELFGRKELLALSDLDRTGQINSAAVDKAIAGASADIDSYIATRYPLPLPENPVVLVDKCADIVRYKMTGSAGRLMTEGIRERYEDAIRWLRDVAAGKASLGLTEDKEPVDTGDVVLFVEGQRNVFGRNKWGHR